MNAQLVDEEAAAIAEGCDPFASQVAECDGAAECSPAECSGALVDEPSYINRYRHTIQDKDGLTAVSRGTLRFTPVDFKNNSPFRILVHEQRFHARWDRPTQFAGPTPN